MAIGRESSTGAQDRDEKKDHPRRGGGHRGQEDNERFGDPEWEKAEGHRAEQSQPGRKSGAPAEGPNQPAGDNTVSGGNRPKVSHRGQDHN